MSPIARDHAISIHALLAESDPLCCRRCSAWRQFLSTLSLRRATCRHGGSVHHQADFYPRSPCGERPFIAPSRPLTADISIHALLAESDLAQILGIVRAPDISIHALLAESDAQQKTARLIADHFYPRSPCGERLGPISAGSIGGLFLSTLSLRRATFGKITSVSSGLNFYPRSPCGERHDTSSLMQCQAKFLSTLSLRRATFGKITSASSGLNFYPRSPCGERRPMEKGQVYYINFYPRSPCGERRLFYAL